MNDLLDTIPLMQSKDFKDRAKAEYHQLKIRHDRLSDMLTHYREGILTFTPNCPYDLLHAQLVYMEGYMRILEERAVIEFIDL